MPVIVDFKVEGLKEIEAEMLALGTDAATRLLRAATRAGAKIIADRASELAPVGDRIRINIRKKSKTRIAGTTKNSIRARAVVDVKNAVAVFQIGPSGKAWYARFIEDGTKFIAPRSFLRRAMDEKAQEAIDAMAEQVSKRVAAAQKKLARGAK